MWIAQINPEHFDFQVHIARVTAGQVPPEGEWPVPRYREQIATGDHLLFWQSGQGFVATGVCTSTAYRSNENPEFEWCVGYRLEGAFSMPLSRAQFKDVLQDTLFWKRPQGGLFKLTPEQTDDLWEQLKPLLHPLPVPAAPRLLAEIQQDILALGLRLQDRTLRQYHLALQTRSLVILQGPSGNGKSWLTRAYASASGARYLLVPVSPHWLSPEDFLGYYNAASGSFMGTAASRFIAEAAEHWKAATARQEQPVPYHLVLDEINLARTEHYFAPLLSLLEVRRRGESAQYERIGAPPLDIPPNLRCIGTANAPEMSRWSERVYDRAFILDIAAPPPELREFFRGKVRQHMEQIWPELTAAYPISYRTLEDLQHYIAQARIYGIPELEALDEALVQKLIHRTPSSKSMLEALSACIPDTLPLCQRQLLNHLNDRDNLLFSW